MLCKKCGFEIDDESNFCKKCGTPAIKDAPLKTTEEASKKITPEETEERKRKGSWLIQLVVIGIVIVFAIIILIISKCGGNLINYKNYQKIKFDMSYEQVCEILGRNCDENQLEDHQHQVCTWSNNNNAKIIITFTDNKVTEKTPIGLNQN